MGIGRLSSAQDIRDIKQKETEVFMETPSFTDDEVEILKEFKERCNEKGIDAEQLLDKLSKVK